MSEPASPEARSEPAPQPAAAPAHPPAPRGAHRDYEGRGIVVHWDAGRCIHTGRCIAAQPAVFDPKRRPWVEAGAADADAVAAAVERCPTGALTYTRTDGAPQEAVPDVVTVRVTRDGPLALRGAVRAVGERAGPLGADRTAAGRVALCRCGGTRQPPFCDNTHRLLPPGWGGAGGA